MPTPAYPATVLRRRCARLLLRGLLGVMAWTTLALAAPASRRFNIAAGPADQGLRAFAAQSGRELLFSTEAARGVRINAVQGEFTAEAALALLVADTGLRVAVGGADDVLRVVPDRERPARGARPVAPARPPLPPGPESGSGPIALSPFEVRTDKDSGYVATTTLAGSRLNTALRDTPASISVFTREFLDDIGAVDVAQALDYALNGAPDLTDATGNAITSNDLLVQFRGFTGASLGRNYFTWSLSSDSYNIERLDFSRGPNSILFGIGGPGGILNTSTKRARPGADRQQARVRVGAFGELRGELDVSRTLVAGRLAVRVNLQRQERDDWREFVGAERTGAALAATWRPFARTEIRFDGEYGDVNQVVTQPWPAQDRFQAWVVAGRPYSANFGEVVTGTSAISNRQFVFDPASGFGPISWGGGRATLGGPAAPSLGNNTAAITDERILPHSTAITGPGFRGDYHFSNAALFLEQRAGDLAFEAAFNRQSEQREQFRPQVFSDVALRIDVNATLPDGRPNPRVGQFYTDGQLQVDYRDQIRDDARLTGSYDLDLSRHGAAWGRHTFTGLVARRDVRGHNDGLNEVNLTPDGSAFYPADLSSANNLIRRRTYLDFASGDPAWRGLHDPRRHPIATAGVRSGLARTRDGSSNELTRVDSRMAALQSRLFAERLVLTAGWRNDRQRQWAGTADLNGNGDLNDDRHPITRTFPRRRRSGTASHAEGDTRTFGGVFHAAPWLALFYNNANNFTPQPDRDIAGRPVGHRRGQGEDAGLRLNLLGGRVNGTFTLYRTDELNAAVSRDSAFINAINTIWQSLERVDRFADASSRDGQNTQGRGWEFELTANPIAQWRLAANFSRTQQTLADLHPRNGAYIEAHRALWEQSAARLAVPVAAAVPPLDSLTGQPSTIATAIRVIDQIYAGIRQAEGQSRRQLREYNGNVFTTYRFFPDRGRLSHFTLGGGANYRGRGVIGYDTSRQNAPLYGRAYVLVNALAAWNGRLSGRPLRLQLNVDNLLGEAQPIVTDADQQRVYRVIFQQPRRWHVSATVGF